MLPLSRVRESDKKETRKNERKTKSKEKNTGIERQQREKLIENKSHWNLHIYLSFAITICHDVPTVNIYLFAKQI